MNWVPAIDSVQHVCEWRRRDSNPAIGRRLPDEAALLQPLGVERHAEPVMPKNLNQVTSGASEDVKIAGMRIAPQGLLNLKGQAVHAAPHIRSSDREPDPHTRGNRDQRRSSTSSTRRSACASTPLLTRTRYLPARSISMVSATAAALMRRHCGVCSTCWSDDDPDSLWCAGLACGRTNGYEARHERLGPSGSGGPAARSACRRSLRLQRRQR